MVLNPDRGNQLGTKRSPMIDVPQGHCQLSFFYHKTWPYLSMTLKIFQPYFHFMKTLQFIHTSLVLPSYSLTQWTIFMFQFWFLSFLVHTFISVKKALVRSHYFGMFLLFSQVCIEEDKYLLSNFSLQKIEKILIYTYMNS